MIYFLIFAVLVAFSYADPRRLYWPLLSALFLFAAFRFETGCDWSGYFNQFTVQGGRAFDEAILDPEPLWNLVLYFQQAADIPYPWLNVFAAAVFFMGIHQIANRLRSPFAFLVLLFPILVINMPMSAIKQATAIGVLCFAYIAFTDKRMFRFVAFVVIASLIHNSAAIFLLLTPLVSGEITKGRLFLAAILALPGMVALAGTAGAEQATQRYIEADLDAAGAIFRVLLLSMSGLAYLYIRIKGWLPKAEAFRRLKYLGAILMVASLGLLPVSTVIADRFGYYLVPIQAIILANLRYANLPHLRRLIVATPYIVLLLTFGVWTTYSTHFAQCYIPYESWLFGYPNRGMSLYAY